jgi:hypothetical protein
VRNHPQDGVAVVRDRGSMTATTCFEISRPDRDGLRVFYRDALGLRSTTPTRPVT